MQFTKWSLKKSVIFCLVSTKLKQISEKSEFKFVRDRSKLKSWVLEYESGSELSNQPLEPDGRNQKMVKLFIRECKGSWISKVYAGI